MGRGGDWRRFTKVSREPFFLLNSDINAFGIKKSFLRARLDFKDTFLLIHFTVQRLNLLQTVLFKKEILHGGGEVSKKCQKCRVLLE